MTDTDLIRRLEEATEGCRQADMDIAEHIGWTHVPPALSGPECWLDENGVTQAMLPHYTTSIDAALTLVPEGYGISVSNPKHWDGTEDKLPYARVYGVEKGHYVKGTAETPALALCIAALRARRPEME